MNGIRTWALALWLPLFILSLAACKKDSSTTGTNNPPQTQGTISASSTPAGATILIDGTNTGRVTPSSITVGEGTHQVRLTLIGYRDWNQQVGVVANQTSIVNVTLAQAELFEEFFENGLGNWTQEGSWPWSLSSDTVYEGISSLHFRSGAIHTQGNPNTATAGILTWNGSFSLASTSTAYLYIWGRKGAGNNSDPPSGASIYWDVEFSLDGGVTWTNYWRVSQSTNWLRTRVNISSLTGPGSANVKIRIRVWHYNHNPGCGQPNTDPCAWIDSINIYVDALYISNQ